MARTRPAASTVKAPRVVERPLVVETSLVEAPPGLESPFVEAPPVVEPRSRQVRLKATLDELHKRLIESIRDLDEASGALYSQLESVQNQLERVNQEVISLSFFLSFSLSLSLSHSLTLSLTLSPSVLLRPLMMRPNH